MSTKKQLSDEIIKFVSNVGELSFANCQKSVEKGEFNGKLMLGYCYECGIDVEKNEHKAFKYYEESANMNNSYGMIQVGHCYLQGIGIEKNDHQAFTWCKKSAEKGNVFGIFMLGYCYESGIGIEKDENKAFIYYQKSADKGNSNGMFQVGHYYEYGIGVEIDKNKAFENYKNSAKAGNSKGFSKLVTLSDEMGRADGMLQVGSCYLHGYGTERDERKASSWYKKSAEKGNAFGIFMLGYCYESGIGIEKDENKAFTYYQKSADMNDSNGMYQVGYCYYLGIGVEIDKHQAFTYYLKSAEAGNSMGIWKTAFCYCYGIGVKEDNKFYEWIEKDPLLYSSNCRLGVDPREVHEVHDSRRCVYRPLARKLEYGKCAHCNENNTFEAWCLSCDPDIATRWTSRNKDIDDCMKEFQLRAWKYENVIEWIPFDRLSEVKEIGKGGFGSVFSALWLDGIRKVETIKDGDNDIYKRVREPSSIVALKTLFGSKTRTNQNSCDSLSEFKNHMQCILFGSELQIYGLTYNSATDEYLMVFQYADDGNFHKFLRSNFNKLTWEFKLNQLKKISEDLIYIHDAGYVHADFHSGNILHNKGTSFISDLGLSKKQNENNPKGDYYGIIPYLAPEVLLGKMELNATQEADIYGFGVIMAEISTNQRPFGSYESNAKLAVKICKGLRPEFALETPKYYIELAEKCMDSNLYKRPTASHVHSTISGWLKKITSSNDNEKLIWEPKLNHLKNISEELSYIHSVAGYVYADFHNGIILQNKSTSFVSDLELSKKQNANNLDDNIFGVMPYVAPEVLLGKQPFTQKADIYGFGIIMVEMSTGLRPFDSYHFDTRLAVKICKGLRPEFALETPRCYIELAKKCMDSDLRKRPSAFGIRRIISVWLDKIASSIDNEIKKQFLDADKSIINKSLPKSNHPDEMYTSKIINTKLISMKIEDWSHSDSAQIKLDITKV